MPADLLAVLVAYYLDGLTERQAAVELGITRHQCRTRHAQALAILRCELS